jgi:hypothetical protein
VKIAFHGCTMLQVGVTGRSGGGGYTKIRCSSLMIVGMMYEKLFELESGPLALASKGRFINLPN